MPTAVRERMSEAREREGAEGVVEEMPLLVAALMGLREEREERGEGISPLLLATMMSRREEREKETV